MELFLFLFFSLTHSSHLHLQFVPPNRLVQFSEWVKKQTNTHTVAADLAL